MIIKYDFLSNIPGETTEVEVCDELGKIVEQIENAELKNNRTETRRHKYMSELEEQGHYIADDSDPFVEIIKSERNKKLVDAIEKLQPQQQALLIRVYWNGEKQKKVAAEEGVLEMAISKRMNRIYKNLKKFLK